MKYTLGWEVGGIARLGAKRLPSCLTPCPPLHAVVRGTALEARLRVPRGEASTRSRA